MKKKLKNCSLKIKIQLTYILFIFLSVIILLLGMYAFYAKFVRESVLSNVQVGGNQISNNIVNFLDSVEQLSLYPIMDKEIVEILRSNYLSTGTYEIKKMQDKKLIEDKLYYNMMNMNSYIDEICIYSANREFSYVKAMSSAAREPYRPEGENWYRDILNADGAAVLMGVGENKRSSDKEKVIALGRSIEDPVGGHSLGIEIIKIKVSKFVKLWMGKDEDQLNILVADENQTLLKSNNMKMNITEIPISILENQDPEKVRIFKDSKQKTSYYVVTSKIEGTNWHIYQFFSRDELMGPSLKIVRTILLISISLLLCLLGVAALISRTITKPIEILAGTMWELEKGNLDVRSPNMEGEMGKLAAHFNRMLDQTNILIGRIYDSEKEKRELELKALQSQINPHFIYNTLNSIKMMSQMQGAHNITHMLEAFVQLLSYSARLSDEFVTIRSEVEFIKNYMDILNMRYFEKFQVMYDIEEGVLDCHTLRFILQPIVENAVVHGLGSIGENACLSIKIYGMQENVIYEVTDNGIGISEEKAKEILTQDIPGQLNKIGVFNVNRRIKMTFGEEYGVHIKSAEGKYTKVSVLIPRCSERENFNENFDCG